MGKMTGGKASPGGLNGKGARFPAGGYTVRSSSSAKSNTSQPGALKINKSIRG